MNVAPPKKPTPETGQDASDEPGFDPLRLRRRLIALVGLISAIVVVVFYFSAVTAYDRAEDAAMRQAATLARAIEEHAGKSIGAADRTIVSLARQIAAGTADGRRDLLLMFRERRDLVPGSLAAFTIDAAGNVRVDTAAGTELAVDAATSMFFAMIDRAPYDVTQISPPIYVSRTDSWHVYLARRFKDKFGNDAGFVAMTLDLGYFREFHGSLDVGKSGTIALWRDDGMLLTRQPADLDQIGRTYSGPMLEGLRAGKSEDSVLVRSPIDGIERRLSWRRIANLPVVASVALASSDYRAPLDAAIRQQALAVAVGGVLVTVLAIIAWLHLGRLSRLGTLYRADREQLARSQRQLRAVIDAVPGIINAKDENGRYTLMNAFQARIFGITPEAAVGRSLSEFTSAEFAREVEVRERVARRTRTTSHDVEDTFLVDGVPRSFLASKIPIVDSDGVSRQTVSVAFDISTMKSVESKARAAEAQLRAALDSIPEGFAIFDEQDRLTVANRPFAEMFTDHGDPARIVGQTYEEVVRGSIRAGEPPGEDHTPESWVEERVRRHREVSAEPNLIKIGGARWVSVAEQHVPGIGVVGISTDVTRLVETEAELRSARDQAEAANRAKSQFLANMSHELRTPLNAIIGFSEIIESQIFGPAGHPRYVEYARDIAASGRHLVALIGDVLDMSKIEAGRLELEESRVDAVEVISGAAALVNGEALTRGVRLSYDAAELENVALWADSRALRQVLLNLLSNAIKFTPSGGRVELRGRRAPGGGITIEVSDTGVGIPAADLPHVTEPFRQAPGTAAIYGGTGLGLSITKHLVEMHQGTLDLESAPGRGTTVRVNLPATRVASTLAA
ncbi:MAG: PAS domain S-box protein [Alphaproteobacteria bacterium]|nr:PAS domain S-box protein [Alphaproteobacteria bacterium]